MTDKDMLRFIKKYPFRVRIKKQDFSKKLLEDVLFGFEFIHYGYTFAIQTIKDRDYLVLDGISKEFKEIIESDPETLDSETLDDLFCAVRGIHRAVKELNLTEI